MYEIMLKAFKYLIVHAVHKIEEEIDVLLSPVKRKALSYRRQRQDRCVTRRSHNSVSAEESHLTELVASLVLVVWLSLQLIQ